MGSSSEDKNQRRVLTVSQLASELQVGKSKVLDAISSGKLKAANVGNGTQRPRHRIRREDADRWFDSMCHTPAKVERKRPRRDDFKRWV